LDDVDAIERFTGLYDRYRNRVYAYAVSRAGRQLADEVVSEVFLVAWRRLDELPTDPLPWLLVTARNVIGSEFRAAARQESLAAELSSWGSGVASDAPRESDGRQPGTRTPPRDSQPARKATPMDVMDLLAQARPGSLDPRPEADRRASDLARAIATPRDGMTAQPGVSRRLGVRRASPPARVIAIGVGAAALAATAGAVVAVSVTGTPAPRLQPAAASVATPGEVRNAILTAFSGVGGDIFYDKITEIYSGKMSKWNGVSQSWAYPLQPQAGQQAYVRNLVVPSSPGQKGDSELIWTEPSASKQGIPTKTKVIDVEYGSRTWSVTSSLVAVQTETGDLQALRESIVNGKLTVVRKTVIDGQTVLELTTRSKDSSTGSGETWWVNPATWLPVRTLTINSAVSIQVDYAFLPPTPANIAELKVTIPAGFTRTPTIQK